MPVSVCVLCLCVAQEGTGVWRAVNLASREACLTYCTQRQEQLAGSPYWHSEALTADGRMMFVHFQNVLMNKDSKTLMGLSSGILVHCFDEEQHIRRCVCWQVRACVCSAVSVSCCACVCVHCTL